jgi:lipoprotein NlpD
MERMSKILTSFFSIGLILLFILSCSAPSPYHVQKEPAKGIYHRVKKGETFWSIARAYNVNLQDLAEANNISNPKLIEEGSVIFIPDANSIIDDVMAASRTAAQETKTVIPADSTVRVKTPLEKNNERNTAELSRGEDKKAPLSAPTAEKTKLSRSTTADTEKEAEPVTARKSTREKPERKYKPKTAAEEKEEIKFEKKRFIWPVAGSVKTRFGIQPNNTYHNWIKISAHAGTQVKAAASGTVIFSSQLKDYGETIIVRHEESFATVYSHLKKRYVKNDQNVKKGDVIAITGEKDEAGDAYMNFEVRLHGKARNPLFFLP